MKKTTRRLKKKWKVTGLLLVVLIVFLVMAKSLTSNQPLSSKRNDEIELADNTDVLSDKQTEQESSENGSAANDNYSGNKQNDKEDKKPVSDSQSQKTDLETGEIDIHTDYSKIPESTFSPEMTPGSASANEPARTPEITPVPESTPVTTPAENSDPAPSPTVSPESEPTPPSVVTPEPSSEPVPTSIPESESHENDGEIDP